MTKSKFPSVICVISARDHSEIMFRITVKTNGRNNSGANFSFSVKLSSFAFASKARIIFYYLSMYSFFQENFKCESHVGRLPFAVNAVLNLRNTFSLRLFFVDIIFANINSLTNKTIKK